MLFLAGGPGAGKSVAVSRLGQAYLEAFDFVLDGVFGDVSKARERVRAALRSGRSVTILYVHRPLDMAVAGVFRRALATGRIVPLDTVVDLHLGAQETITRLSEEFANEPAVAIIVLDLTGDGEDFPEVGVKFLRDHRYIRRSHRPL